MSVMRPLYSQFVMEGVREKHQGKRRKGGLIKKESKKKEAREPIRKEGSWADRNVRRN